MNSEWLDLLGGEELLDLDDESNPLPLGLKRKRAKNMKNVHGNEEVLSMETRARRKRELVQLRNENKCLRQERTEFLSKIEQLEKENQEGLISLGVDVASENHLLRAQLEEHRNFIARFTTSLNGISPKLETGSEEVIYREGADAAQSYLTSLISQSQQDWLRLRVPDRISEIGVLQSVQMSYRFKTDFFGEKEKGEKMRLNIRFDALLGNTKPEVAADLFWRTFSNQDVQQRLYKSTNIAVQPIEGKMPDRNTKVVHFTRHWDPPKNAQDVVFVVNRKRQQLVKSTLAPPRRTSGKSTIKNTFPNEFGHVSAISVATTSTTLYAEPKKASGEPQGSSNESKKPETPERIESLVVKGAVVWNDEEGARLVLIYSVPEEYQVIPGIKFNDIINDRGYMSRRFTRLVEEVCFEFCSLLAEEVQMFAEGKVSEDDMEIPSVF
eukprot:CAMPEP_0203766676 /NCGR_PEP_ID=MMETSP0099_2-20121227/555_1 /ASSEMBLY_ACC=CAM_ASM_000209 /TAXON_ID=96639 /ORGANISM=" , Strain NY0313808BC1" /LENGTH=438 /DNA_ID=CAMNT_0050663063 /DNA_START=392 /DNA_END=1708 /DNA_ORIENTATION=-